MEVTHTDLLRHVIYLAVEHKVAVIMDQRLTNRGHAAMDTEGTIRSHVRIPIVVNESSYAIALHELGHLLTSDGHLRMHEKEAFTSHLTLRELFMMLQEEHAAWSWAKRHALVWTDEMKHVEKRGIESYKPL